MLQILDEDVMETASNLDNSAEADDENIDLEGLERLDIPKVSFNAI
jgi:hypothetical protein